MPEHSGLVRVHLPRGFRGERRRMSGHQRVPHEQRRMRFQRAVHQHGGILQGEDYSPLRDEIIETKNSTIKGIIINNKNSYIQRDNLFIETVDDSCDTLVRSAIATQGSEGTATPVRTSTNAPTTTPFARMATASIILDRFDASARWASCTPTRATSRRASI